MARRCVATATHSRPPKPRWGGTIRRTNAGDVLGSRRSSRGLDRQRIARGVAARANGNASAPQD